MNWCWSYVGYFLSRTFFFVDTDFVSRMCQSYSGLAMARIYLLSILAASVWSEDSSDDEYYIENGRDARENEFSWQGEMSIKIISDKCSHFVCLPWSNGVIHSNSEHYPVYLKTKNFARVGNKSMTKEGMCGGVIIDEKNILTAAHCTGDKQTDSITVYAGLVNIKKPFLWRRSENEQQFSPNPNPGFFRN